MRFLIILNLEPYTVIFNKLKSISPKMTLPNASYFIHQDKPDCQIKI